MEKEEHLPASLVDIMENPASQAALRELQRREGKPLPLLAGQAIWNPVSHEFVPSNALSKLEKAIKSAQASGLGLNIDINNCTWAEVREARATLEKTMQRAKETYEAKAANNIPRRLLRKGSIFNQVAAPLASLIPDQMGLNVLRAGLGILFAALERRESNREKIFNVFEDIGIVLEDAEELADPNVSPFGPEIQREGVELYTKVLEGLPGLLRIVDPSSTAGHGHNYLKRSISHVVPGIDTTKITEITDSIKKSYDRLQQRVTAVCQLRIAELRDIGVQLVDSETKLLRMFNAAYQVTTNIDYNVEIVKKKQYEMDEKFEELMMMGSNISRSEAVLLENMERLKSIHEQSLQAMKRMAEQLAKTTINGVYQSGCDMQRTREYYHDIYQEGQYMTYSPLALDSPRMREQTHVRKPQQLSSTNILKVIEAPNPLVLHQDIIKVLSDGTTMEDDVLRRGRWLFTIPRFRAWLADQRSDYLFVDGDCSSAFSPRTSALSVICASLLGTLNGNNEQKGQTIALGFFCGEHFQLTGNDSDTDSTSPTAFGPLGILRSLIAQLLTYPRTPVWRFEDQAWAETDFELNDQQAAKAMIRILRSLIAHLSRRTTVYIIIDNLSEYEGTLNDQWDEVIDVLISGLIDIAATCTMDKRGVYVKTLFTCVSRCLALEKALDLGDEFQDYEQDHHISLWGGNVDSRAGVASAFESDLQDLFTPPGCQSDSE
ncbi:hypothetical protein QBC37DRAFT_162624 [Rhypophila decipiens]|uniref:Nephrocystin 3-like N-terminal domain-containing protein n=1 Tax=Rhypophila decipiens TaxID=261697 RepID=A0AAN7B8H9_9PEZI|nr:hypothetical protein QBC37DRAFT_162624 [Rhypophila decipiens]